jgi:hypothetical protein
MARFLSTWLMILAVHVDTAGRAAEEKTESFDVVVVGGTPGGIMAAIGAARSGRTVVILERNKHIGGLPANGLGATDIHTRGATAGLFREFVQQIHDRYVKTYGKDSPQARDCDHGYHFEPSVAEKVFERMLAEQPRIAVRRLRQFDVDPKNVSLAGSRLQAIRVTNRETNAIERYRGHVFVDATYEGDLAAAAGAPFRLGREGKVEFNEPLAGVVYKRWGGPVGPGTTYLADNSVQAYNFRLCLTTDPDNLTPIAKPENYNREEFASLIGDVKQGRTTGDTVPKGMWRLVNMVKLPNNKTDSNNQHFAFISTDLPEENWPWPTSGWAWRDRFAKRLRDYTLGLLWFAQHDPELPEDFRRELLRWGLAKDEYVDNDNFPRQVYVREGRRIEGEHLLTAHDSLPVKSGGRPPIHANSITASHYAIDSHAVRKREPGRVHLDGFLSHPTQPYTVPYGVIVPKTIDGLLTPVPVSGTHLGFGTLRMEPCWMAMGQAAGVAAALSIEDNVQVRKVDMPKLQQRLLEQGAVLIYYRDATPEHPHFRALQFFALRGLLPEWRARLDESVSTGDAARWLAACGIERLLKYVAGKTTRGEFLDELHQAVLALPPEKIRAIGAAR